VLFVRDGVKRRSRRINRWRVGLDGNTEKGREGWRELSNAITLKRWNIKIRVIKQRPVDYTVWRGKSWAARWNRLLILQEVQPAHGGDICSQFMKSGGLGGTRERWTSCKALCGFMPTTCPTKQRTAKRYPHTGVLFRALWGSASFSLRLKERFEFEPGSVCLYRTHPSNEFREHLPPQPPPQIFFNKIEIEPKKKVC
jgi:hypothetical protein